MNFAEIVRSLVDGLAAGYSPAELLDENSPIVDKLRKVSAPRPSAGEARYIGIPCEAKDESHEYKPAIFLGVDSCGYEPMIQFPGRMPWFSMWHSVRGLDRDAICKHYRELYATPPSVPQQAAPEVVALVDAWLVEAREMRESPEDGPSQDQLDAAEELEYRAHELHAALEAARLRGVTK